MKHLYKYFRNFAQNERGIISVEFAILAPVILAWVLTSYTFFDGFKSYMRASKATYTAVDLVSRQDVVDDAFVETVGSIFESIVDGDGTPPSMVVTSILQVDANTKRVQWSTAYNGGTRIYDESELPQEAIPNMTDGETLVLIQTEVAFDPLIGLAAFTATTFSNQVAITPRFHPEITNTDQINGPVRVDNPNVDEIDDDTGTTRS